ncbi:MAG: PRC-barrel domain-containing protein [Proteobacteria bacterium]|nr:PRC-barrel domain-containing protein [Pseudomonadota bacterium]
MKRLLSAGLFSTALVAGTFSGAAVAQTKSAVPTAGGYYKLDDMKVVNQAGEEIGEVETVLIDRAGKVNALAIDIEGRGAGEVVMNLEQLRLVEGRLVTQLTRDQLMALPKWGG